MGVKVKEREVMEFQNMIPIQNRINFYINSIFSKSVGILKSLPCYSESKTEQMWF